MPTKEAPPGRAGSGRAPGSPTRRRGARLEAALLQAAWDELTSVGYGAFTMEGVATRAKTSRAVLYRRWSNRPELAMVAIRHQTKLATIDIPDTGTLRDDVLALLRHMSARVGEVVGVVSFLITDYFNETGLPAAVLRERTLAGESTAWQIVLDRAVARGEIAADRLSPRIASLPLDLVRHDVIMNRATVPDKTLVEIVDRIFLPLLSRERMLVLIVQQPLLAERRSPSIKEQGNAGKAAAQSQNKAALRRRAVAPWRGARGVPRSGLSRSVTAHRCTPRRHRPSTNYHHRRYHSSATPRRVVTQAMSMATELLR